MADRPGIVAHRGWATRYPENTLAAINGALAAGVRAVEFDVQLSRDGVPIVIHDATLQRTAGLPDTVMETDWSRLSAVRVGDDRSVPLSSLADVATALVDWPQARFFVELKSESISAFGTSEAVAAVLDAVAPILPRVILTSFDAQALRVGRGAGVPAIAWVFTRYDDESLALAAELAPEYLFCNHRKLPEGDSMLPAGPWTWVIYEVRSAEHALALAARGVDLIETMAAGELNAALRAGGDAA